MADPDIRHSGPLVTREEALERGATRYFSGAPCFRGHIAERHAKWNGCVTCAAARVRKSYAKHREEIASVRKARYHANPEKILARGRRWRSANPDKMAALCRLWYVENRTKSIADAVKWMKEHPDRASRTKKVSEGKRRAAKRLTASSPVSGDDVLALLTRQRFKCHWCKTPLKKKWHLDHVIPLSKGGPHALSNLAASCITCNLQKGPKHPVVWARELGLLI